MENKRTKVVENLHYIFIVAVVFMYCILKVIAINPDNDSYFLITTGKYIVENRVVPTTNVWTMHENFDIVIQQWLPCIINYFAYNLLGQIGLIILAVVLYCIMNVIIYNYIKLFTNNSKIIIIALCIVNITLANFINARPHSISIIVISLAMMTLEKFRRQKIDKKNSIKFIITMTVLSLIEINCHAAMWAMLLVMMLPYLVPQVWNIKETTIDKKKTLVIIGSMISMIIIAFINPNGIDAIAYVLNSYKNTMNISFIGEMKTVEILSSYSIQIILATILFIINLVNKKCNKELIYLAIGTIIFASMHIRNIWFIVYALAQLICLTLNDKLNNKFEKETTIINYRIILISYIITALGVVIFLSANCINLKTEGNNLHKENVEIADYLDEHVKNKEDIKIFNEYNNGSYLELRGYKVYIDTRAEAYSKSINNKKDILTEYMQVFTGSIDIEKFVNEYEFTHLVVDNSSCLNTYLMYNDEYTLGLKGARYNLYYKK